MNRLWTVFKTQLAPGAKAAVIAGLLLLVVAFAVGTGTLVSRLKDSAFARRESERETERQQLQRERDAAVGRAEAAEKRESELSAKAAVAEAVVAAEGRKAQEAANRIEEETKRYEDDMEAIGNPVSDDDRRKRICERVRKLYPEAKCNQ